MRYPLYGIGRWVDKCLKELLPFYKTCIKNSDDVLRILKDVKLVHDEIFVTTCDAELMHPNISTEEGLAFAMAALDSFVFKVNPSWRRR